MSEDIKGFEGWAIVELMGHGRIAGLCSEQPIAGTNMLRVDVPELNGNQGYTRYFSGGSIYSLIPTDERAALVALSQMDTRPVDRWVVPDNPHPRRLPPPCDDGQEEDERDLPFDEEDDEIVYRERIAEGPNNP